MSEPGECGIWSDFELSQRVMGAGYHVRTGLVLEQHEVVPPVVGAAQRGEWPAVPVLVLALGLLWRCQQQAACVCQPASLECMLAATSAWPHAWPHASSGRSPQDRLRPASGLLCLPGTCSPPSEPGSLMQHVCVRVGVRACRSHGASWTACKGTGQARKAAPTPWTTATGACMALAPTRPRTHGHSVHAPLIHSLPTVAAVDGSKPRPERKLKPVKPGLGKGM